MEMGLETPRRGRESDDLVGEQIGLDGRNPVAVDPLHAVERPQQIEERFAGGPAEVARIDAREHDFALPAARDGLRLGDQIGNRHVAAHPSGQRNRTVAAPVVASILHLEERTRPVAARKGGEEPGQLLRLAGMDRGARLAFQRRDAPVDGPFVAVADHQIDPLDRGDAFGGELGVAARDGH